MIETHARAASADQRGKCRAFPAMAVTENLQHRRMPELNTVCLPAHARGNPGLRHRLPLPLCLLLCLLALALVIPRAHAQAAPRQDLRALRAQAAEFLAAHAANLPGKATVSVNQPDPKLALAACEAPQFSLAPGARAYGKTTLVASCSAPVVWSVYLAATVKLISSYVVAAAPLAQGQRLSEADLTVRQADLASLPAGVLTDPAQGRQRSLLLPVAAGMPVTQSMLRREIVVKAGQSVRLLAQGPGFEISAEAQALSAGAEGEIVRARTASGQVVSGLAQADGVLALHY